MIIEKEYLEAKKIVEIYETEQLNKHAVSRRSEQLFCLNCDSVKLVPFKNDYGCWDCGHHQAK
jgi:hypothetical protein